MEAVYGSKKRNQPPYDPQMMTKAAGRIVLRGLLCRIAFLYARDDIRPALGAQYRLGFVGALVSDPPFAAAHHLILETSLQWLPAEVVHCLAEVFAYWDSGAAVHFWNFSSPAVFRQVLQRKER